MKTLHLLVLLLCILTLASGCSQTAAKDNNGISLDKGDIESLLSEVATQVSEESEIPVPFDSMSWLSSSFPAATTTATTTKSKSARSTNTPSESSLLHLAEQGRVMVAQGQGAAVFAVDPEGRPPANTQRDDGCDHRRLVTAFFAVIWSLLVSRAIVTGNDDELYGFLSVSIVGAVVYFAVIYRSSHAHRN